MIVLTRPNGHALLVNADIIERAEASESPNETIVTLVNGNVVVVREDLEEIRRRAIEFKARVHAGGKGLA
ncbi:MAG TPA: flagellar FlbD family protein [Candidatus Baltobacteraceae bacterium]|jgi:uncharacterized protein YlzI (FlbEa/FlbD family)|nr:flagellar FlbD family protein [Candidatus Baltobacteraceae bacterium]